MKGNYKLIILPLLFIVAVTAVTFFVRSHEVTLFDPQGPIAHAQRTLILFALVLMLALVLPVIILVYFMAWRYKAKEGDSVLPENTKDDFLRQLVWWLVPAFVVVIFAVVTWQSAHALDPYVPLKPAPGKSALSVQVVSLDWKWLFIYPQQGIATVNYLELPAQTPVNFQLTSDGPMNDFWIPQLGGQIYSMAGMVTQLNLMASKPGDFRGQAAEINGQGFAGMKFAVKAVPQDEFDAWVATMKQGSSTLSWDNYKELAKPSEDVPPTIYAGVDPELYLNILAQYLSPDGTSAHAH